ncbi:Ppx/GppA family phosphatase [Magnetovibrio sp.]|uniref:Ppx/GppA family phosphatase n=1 Tax=Magnetovibrio sp. TaxID=2024836 RepID=UPI002F94770F
MNKIASAKPGEAHGRVAVVDIGSNSVRLVVYDAPTRLPIPMYNEKAQCALGRGLGASGVLHPAGVECALSSIKRFVGLAKAMGVAELELVATAAVREAADGPEFVARIHDSIGHDIQILSGEDEAKYAALGLLMGVPRADGVIGDLGGGSLDLVGLESGSFTHSATLPFGHIRLSEAAEGNPERARAIVLEALSELKWLKSVKGRTLYAAGGSWRALARILIDQTSHPLHVVDNFTIGAEAALKIMHLISGAGRHSLDLIPGVPKKRVETLPFAAAALEGMLVVSQAAKLQFSGFGMREGVLLSCLPDTMRHQDPLLSACKTMAERTGRFSVKGREMLEWMAPLYPDETPAEQRLRYAACLMSDIGWNEHPDYRAEHSFLRVLRVPYAGLTHADRALLASTVYVRQNGDLGDPLIRPILGLLDVGQLSWIKVTGLALRLAHTISGSAPGVLNKTRLELGEDNLQLLVDEEDRDALLSEAVQRRLKTLGRALGLKGKME